MNRKFYSWFLGLAIVGLIFSHCKNPLDDVEIAVDSNIFKYTTLLEVNSTSGNPIGTNATVTITGTDAAKIYNLDGRRSFQINGGILGLAVAPGSEPTASTPLNFNVSIAVPGHLTTVIPVRINASQKGSFTKVSVLDISNPPQGVAIETKNVALSATGATTVATTLATTGSSATPEAVSIALPAGTQFKDAAGNNIVASNLSVSTLTANTGNPTSLTIFPGGSLSSPSVKTSSGTNSPGTLLPAALTEISMTAGTTNVKSFNQPISVNMQLDEDFYNPTTKAKVKAGDVISIYSFSAEKGIWEYENTGTVVSSGGKLSVNVNSTHLTWFMAGDFATSCSSPLTVKLTAGWLAADVTHPVTVKVFSTNGAGRDKVLGEQKITATNESELVIASLPQQEVIIVAYDVDGNELATSTVANPCTAGTVTLNLATSPTANNPKITMQLYVRCPNNTGTVTILPTFYLYYKETNSASAEYKLLGIVEKGYITTTLISTAKRYDFKAIWGSNIKIVGNQEIKVENLTTLGDFNGAYSQGTNLQILTEKCRELGY